MVDDNYAVLAGQKLRNLRKEAGYTVIEFAKLSNCVTEQRLYRYERGINKIDIDTLVLLLKLLNASTSVFFEELVAENSEQEDLKSATCGGDVLP